MSDIFRGGRRMINPDQPLTRVQQFDLALLLLEYTTAMALYTQSASARKGDSPPSNDEVEAKATMTKVIEDIKDMFLVPDVGGQDD